MKSGHGELGEPQLRCSSPQPWAGEDEKTSTEFVLGLVLGDSFGTFCGREPSRRRDLNAEILSEAKRLADLTTGYPAGSVGGVSHIVLVTSRAVISCFSSCWTDIMNHRRLYVVVIESQNLTHEDGGISRVSSPHFHQIRVLVLFSNPQACESFIRMKTPTFGRLQRAN